MIWSNPGETLCDDCPPKDYPTDKTRCRVCPRRKPDTQKPDRDQIALDAAHQIECLPSDLRQTQRTARIQLIVLAAMDAQSHKEIAGGSND